MMPTKSQVFFYWMPLVMYAGLIVFLSSSSHPDEYFPDQLLFKDKLAHGLEYAILGIFTFRALQHGLRSRSFPYAAPFAIMAATLFGMSDEIHQYFVPFRDMDVWDVFADCIGSAIGVWGWGFFRSHVQGREADKQMHKPYIEE